jgi:two-component system, OmpR family, response regulator
MGNVADVLVVDDDADIRRLVSFALEDFGFAVREAENGEAALAALAERPPDVMLVDVVMPGLDGFGVLKAMRQQGLAPRTRVVLLTSRVEERDYLRGWELGCDDYVTKPFDTERLGRRVQDVLLATAEMLQERRETELQKAELLDRLEAAFNRPRQSARPARPVRA